MQESPTPQTILTTDAARTLCLQLDPFKKWEDQPDSLQEMLTQLGLKDLYLEDPFKLTNFLLSTLHNSETRPSPDASIQ